MDVVDAVCNVVMKVQVRDVVSVVLFLKKAKP